MENVLRALKKTLLSGSSKRSLIEGIFRWDFKVGDSRENLMQICFSSLASWPLLAAILLLNFDPSKGRFSLPNLIGHESSLMYFLLDGHLDKMLIFFGLLFVAEWLVRRETVFMLLICFLCGRGELHVNLAFSGMAAVLLARVSYMWWLTMDCEGRTRHVWRRVHQFMFVSWITATAFTAWALDGLQTGMMFQSEGVLTRLNFLAFFLASFYFLNQLLLSMWGHFYIRRPADPSELPVYYSSAQWILRTSLSSSLMSLLKKEIAEKILQHQASLRQLTELKKENTRVSSGPLESALAKELEYLKEANLRLSRA